MFFKVLVDVLAGLFCRLSPLEVFCVLQMGGTTTKQFFGNQIRFLDFRKLLSCSSNFVNVQEQFFTDPRPGCGFECSRWRLDS